MDSTFMKGMIMLVVLVVLVGVIPFLLAGKKDTGAKVGGKPGKKGSSSGNLSDDQQD